MFHRSVLWHSPYGGSLLPLARLAVYTSWFGWGDLRSEERILALLSAHLIVVSGWRGGWREDYVDLDDSAHVMMLQCPTAGIARD